MHSEPHIGVQQVNVRETHVLRH
eukprot:COSAG01_NODE_33675_length_560_cov_2.036876_1_plen_22_part_01